MSLHFFTNITTFGYLPLGILREFAGGLGSCCEKKCRHSVPGKKRDESDILSSLPVDICLFTYVFCVMFFLEVWYVIASLMRATWRMLLNSICCYARLLLKLTCCFIVFFQAAITSVVSVRFGLCRFVGTGSPIGSSQSIVCFACQKHIQIRIQCTPVLPFSPPAKWGSLDFNKGRAFAPLLLPPSSFHQLWACMDPNTCQI